jgi:ABC-type phosphate transport system auxiliary subunit
MALAQEDIEFIKTHLSEWLTEQVAAQQPSAVVYDLELRERMLKVEEELKHQRGLMQQGFARMDKRFEQMDKRFESMQGQMDKRFESMQGQIEKRFAQVDSRFDELTRRMDSFMKWSFATTLTVGGLVIGVLKLWPPGAA